LLKLRGDFVLATSTPLTIGIPALIKKLFGKTPFILEVRDVWPEAVIAIGAIKNKFLQKILYFLEKVLYINATSIVPLSTDMKKSILVRNPQLNNKLSTVIENISEINRFQNVKSDINLETIIGFKPRFVVLYAGTFGKVNGINYIVEFAHKTLSLDDKLVYVLIGAGAEKESVIQLAKNIGVYGKNVFILDPISKNELPRWYRSASMGSSFVIDIKELWANSANKFFDTLAAGKPILINHEGWQAKVIRDYNIGYVLPKIVSLEEAKKFVDYTTNSKLIQEQQNNAISLSKEKYSLERAVEKYMMVFEKISMKNQAPINI
jgi:glycosyltransferase involved in cell wall biosynthesis